MATYQEIRQQIATMSAEEQLQLLEDLAATVRHHLLTAQASESTAIRCDSKTSDLIQFLTQPQQPAPQTTIWEKMRQRADRIPAQEWEQLPIDGAAQHDHYLYGTPKRD